MRSRCKPGAVILILIAALGIMVGCASVPSGSFCTIAKPQRPSQAEIDAMTDARVAEVLAHNRKLQELCGVRP